MRKRKFNYRAITDLNWGMIGALVFCAIMWIMAICVVAGCSNVQTPPWTDVPDVDTVPIVIFKY